MQRLFVSAVLSVVAILGLTLDSQANGLFRRHRGCDSGCGGSEVYGVAPCAVAPCAVAPVQYVEHKVIRYKQVPIEKQVDVTIYNQVTKSVKFFYDVQVAVPQTKVIKQTYYVSVQKPVEFTYTVNVAETVPTKVQRTTYQCVTETVVENVAVCRTVHVSCIDECGRCFTRCERVTVMEPVTRCIVRQVPVVHDVIVNVVTYKPVVKTGTRMVSELVAQERDVTVHFCTFATEKREGTRLVCEIVPEIVKRTVVSYTLVPYEEIVRVAVSTCGDCGTYGAGYDTSCGSGSGYGYGGGHGRGGLFRRGCR